MLENIPLHVVIVPDGNRRWARQRGLKPWEGHEQGAKAIEKISKEAVKMGIKYLTFWGSSVDNLTKRPLEEKRALLSIYERYFERLIGSEDVKENEIRINILGRWKEQFPDKLKNLLFKGIASTKYYTKNFLTFLLAYSGDDELLEAVKKIIKKTQNKELDVSKTSETLLKENLMTGDLPEVDLLIRTGTQGDPHNSAGFMPWHTRNSQYYFTQIMMPDFGPEEFKKAIEDFSQRGRRFGQ